MSITLYANGITEESAPANLAYTDDELIKLYEGFEIIRSYRLSEIPNSWCLWGERIPPDKMSDEYNQFASEIVDADIYSPITIIHDSEINPSWGLTDPVIHYNYPDFRDITYRFFEEIAKIMMEENVQNNKGEDGQVKNSHLIVIEQVGVHDKKVIYRFDLNKQTEEFLIPSNFESFANKIYDFLVESYDDGDIFVIYADKNIIVQVDDHQVKSVVKKIISVLQGREEYEKCSILKGILNRWLKYKKDKKAEEKNNDSSDNLSDDKKMGRENG